MEEKTTVTLPLGMGRTVRAALDAAKTAIDPASLQIGVGWNSDESPAGLSVGISAAMVSGRYFAPSECAPVGKSLRAFTDEPFGSLFSNVAVEKLAPGIRRAVRFDFWSFPETADGVVVALSIKPSQEVRTFGDVKGLFVQVNDNDQPLLHMPCTTEGNPHTTFAPAGLFVSQMPIQPGQGSRPEQLELHSMLLAPQAGHQRIAMERLGLMPKS